MSEESATQANPRCPGCGKVHGTPGTWFGEDASASKVSVGAIGTVTQMQKLILTMTGENMGQVPMVDVILSDTESLTRDEMMMAAKALELSSEALMRQDMAAVALSYKVLATKVGELANNGGQVTVTPF